MADALEQVSRNEIDRLMLFVPPQHGKSLLASVNFPAWHLGQHPDESIIGTSYGWPLAAKNSRMVRDIIQRNIFFRQTFPDVWLAKDAKSLQRWAIADHQGEYLAAGVGGPITGSGAHIFNIDDPLKGRQEAESELLRDAVWEFYSSVALTRLRRPGRVILTQTRWHEDDLAGRLLAKAKEGGDQWHVIEFPALAEKDGDVLGRKEGEALCPELHNKEELERKRANIDERDWVSLYQQRPAPIGGYIFKHEWWRTFPANYGPRLTRLIQSWDTAFKDGEENDWSAVWTAGVGTDGFIYVLDVVKLKATTAQLIGTQHETGVIYDYYQLFANAGLPPTDLVIEDKSSGTAALSILMANYPFLPLQPMNPKVSKTERARAITSYYRSGRVLHRDGTPWLPWFQETCELFPACAVKDPVDAMTQGLHFLALPPTQVQETLSAERVSLGAY